MHFFALMNNPLLYPVRKQLPFYLLMFMLASCSFFKKKQVADVDVIARVGEEELYASDLQNLTKGLHDKDSLAVLKSYAENWVRKKLLLQKAAENIDEEDLGVSKLVEDYREKLMLYEYEKAIINQKLDTVVKPEELAAWYEKMKTSFPLEQDVYQLYFFKLKPEAPDLPSLRKMITVEDPDAEAKLLGYCKEFASSFSVDKGMWYTKENALKNFPVSEVDLVSMRVGKKGYREYKSDDGNWFIKISNTVNNGEPSPLDFVSPLIVKAIIEKRRLDLIDRVYNKVYQDGLKAKSFELFVK
jgi:hypothetical protein